MTLRISGVVQEIVVDDNVPVNSAGEPIFCQPNKNEFWVPILEKAWAKANGSYANIVGKTCAMQLDRQLSCSRRQSMRQPRPSSRRRARIRNKSSGK